MSCVNCGSSDVGVFCAGCGQRTPSASDYSLREVAKAGLGWLTSYDSRLLVTARTLLVRPGQLALDHFEGRRARHLDPFRIFVLANVLAWLVAPYTAMHGFLVDYARRHALFAPAWERLVVLRASLHHITVDEMLRRCGAVAGSVNALAVLCMVPLAALMQAADAGARRRRREPVGTALRGRATALALRVLRAATRLRPLERRERVACGARHGVVLLPRAHVLRSELSARDLDRLIGKKLAHTQLHGYLGSARLT